MELNEKQLILLDNLIYLDQIANCEEGTTVGKFVNEMLEMSLKDPDAFNATITDEQFYYCKDMVNGMNADQWKNVLNTIASDETLMNMKITNVQDENDYNIHDDNVTTGFRAA